MYKCLQFQERLELAKEIEREGRRVKTPPIHFKIHWHGQ